MKCLIATALFLFSSASFAQITLFKGKTKTIISSQLTSSSTTFTGSTGDVGTSAKSNGITQISYCRNSGNEAAVKENNKDDTTTFRTSILRGIDNTVITHPDGTRSTMIDNGNTLTIKTADGLSATFNKFNSVDPAHNAGQYLISYNNNISELKTIYGAGFKFERKGKIAVITNWDGSYKVMITTGKASVIIDSKDKEALVVNDTDRATVMWADGTHFVVVTENGKSQIIRNNGKKDIINSYGGLGLISTENGDLTAIFNYNKIRTDTPNDGSELTKITIDKTTLENVSK